MTIDLVPVAADWNKISNKPSLTISSTTISTTTPLAGGGDLSANRTLSLGGLSTIGTANYVVGVNSGASAWEYKQALGTSNQITVTHAANSITLSTPQDIATGSSVQFAQVTVGNTGVVVGTSTPFSDSSGTLTLQNIDAIDATTETTLEAAIDSLVNLTVVGTIATGTWQGTTVAVDQGGTGAASLNDGYVLLGSGTGAITPLNVTVKGSMLVGDGTTDPQALGVGTNTHVLTADSAQTLGVKWAAAAGGGDFSDGGEAGGAARTLGNTDAYSLGFETSDVTRISIAATGEVTNTSQPCFLAYNSAQDNNVTGGGTEARVDFDTEITDQNVDFSGDIFTAPVTGTYFLATTIWVDGQTAAETYGYVQIYTSNRSYYFNLVNPSLVHTGGTMTYSGSSLCDMDAADTSYVNIYIANGTDIVDVKASWTTFSGFLVC